MAKARVIYWFRTDLRLHDSPALKAALDLDPEVLWPIFTWDPYYVLDCQNDLSASITKLNPKSKLFLLREAPQTVLPKIFKAWGVTHLVFEKDTDSYPRERDAVVEAAAKTAGVQVITRSGRTLWDSDRIVAKNGGKPTMSTTQLQNAGKKLGPIDRPIAAPSSLPDPGEMPLDFEHERPSGKPDINSERRTKKDTEYQSIAGPKGDFSIESMEELGFPSATTPHKGGETRALKLLDDIAKDKKYTATFEKPKTSPAQFEPQSTTLLSPFLHFGALSIRELYWRVQDIVDEYGKGASSPPASLTGQLFFRDMYFAAQAAIGPKFTQTHGNDHCKFIPWHLPSKVDSKTGVTTGEYHIDSPEAEKWFQRWKTGTTGFPWIDALMRQLRQEGWIHHLGRHSVACFLTRGGCYIDWERGAEVFEEYLLDHEPACNAGNWQWLSCTAFFTQYFRMYSPISFPQKWDKNGDFVRHWVPELKNLSAKYIYEPWKAPLLDQKQAGVRITGDGESSSGEQGKTYPKPMFDFGERREICLAAMKTAYKANLYGDDDRVADGSWADLFPAEGEHAGVRDLDFESDDGEKADEGDASDDANPGEKRTAKSQQTTAKKQKTLNFGRLP
ncbi:cryptochrome-2 [Akanthomyces lecanii RCEF 1005]|uniref:Cryptochrome-2 n=1 Tax=Akanthomyces lecanii RCEF 1005 TaxID=1081108 RepID=A0A162K4Z4_CORDF|nr:cryptochrome-2 [Akanthomyces lecanii RCEF 1005]